MKSLQESLFDNDLVQKDIYNEIINRFDPKEYGVDATTDSINYLYEYGVKISNKTSKSELKDIITKIQTGKFIVIVPVDPNALFKYQFKNLNGQNFMIWRKNQKLNDRINVLRISHSNRKWQKDYSFKLDSSVTDLVGAKDLINTMKPYGECSIVFDKKIVNDVCKRLNELL